MAIFDQRYIKDIDKDEVDPTRPVEITADLQDVKIKLVCHSCNFSDKYDLSLILDKKIILCPSCEKEMELDSEKATIIY